MEELTLKRLKDIEISVSCIKIVEHPEELEGKVIESIKTIPLDEVSYMVTKTTDGCIFCASYAKCGDDFIMDSIPMFNLDEIAMEEVEFGYTTHAYHIFELYFEIGLINEDDRKFLDENYYLLKDKAQLDLKISRVEYALEEAVKDEDFLSAAKLKKELDGLR